MLAACGGNDTKTKAPVQEPQTTTSVSDNPDYQKDWSWLQKWLFNLPQSGRKNIGPAYRDVAAKYENTEANVKHLAEKRWLKEEPVFGAKYQWRHPATFSNRCRTDCEVHPSSEKNK